MHGLARFARADLWRVDLSRHDHIVIFGVSGMVRRVSVCHVLTLQMSELRGKVFGEMHAGAHVIACRFPFTEARMCCPARITLPQVRSRDAIGVGIDRVWVYGKDSPQQE